MLIDNVTIVVKAGNGGNGANTFRRTAASSRGGPDGGNGGNGGNVYFVGSPTTNDLRYFRFKKTVHGQNGGNGTKHNGFGKNAQDITIPVPVGTVIHNLDTGSAIEIRHSNKPFLVARGGKGGFGNVKFKSATNQAPKDREPGENGELKNLRLELRLISEIGLIGLPNAGKSSVLAALTNATPTIGAYPFTTLEPNIGMLGTHPIADIPGLIEGASTGVGLGIRFLKHIEKTKILVHCIDSSNPDPIASYQIVRSEFSAFNKALLEKPEIIYLNKTDLVDESITAQITTLFSELGKEVFAGSTYNPTHMQKLALFLVEKLEKVNENQV